jgi:prefoldin subunit 5
MRTIIKPIFQAFNTEIKSDKDPESEALLKRLDSLTRERLEVIINDKLSQEVIALISRVSILEQKVSSLGHELSSVRETTLSIESLKSMAGNLNSEDVKQEMQIMQLWKSVKVLENTISKSQESIPKSKQKSKEVLTEILEFGNG